MSAHIQRSTHMKQVAGITTVIRCENVGFSPAQTGVIATPSITGIMQAKCWTQADWKEKAWQKGL